MTRMIPNDLFLKACRKERTERTPVWLMRQAGRYLPSYRILREKAGSFLKLCKTPELSAEAMLQPVREIGFDAAIIFSDILLPLEAMGIPLSFEEGEGPRLEPVREEKDIERLSIPDPEEALPFLMKSISLVRSELNGSVPLIGFAGAPFTLACYAIEGGSSKDHRKTLRLLYSEPGLFDSLLDKITAATIPYLRAQVRAGADAIQLFESWGGILNSRTYRQFALPCVRRIFSSLKDEGVPMIFYLNGSSHLLREMAASGADVLSIDGRLPLGEAFQRTSGEFALQGNLEPSALFAPADFLRKEAASIVSGAPRRGHVFNLGHGVLPGTPVDSVKLLVDSVREFSRSET